MVRTVDLKEVAERLNAAVDRAAVAAYAAGRITPEYAMMAWAEKAAYNRVFMTAEKLERASDSERLALLEALNGGE